MGKNENQNAQNPEGVIVLGVYMHCQGCADTIVNHLRGFDGVEQIETDMKTHRVIVKGKNADPRKVVDRLRKKTEKHIHLISPTLKVEEKKEQKKEEPKIFEVVMKILMHCEGCAEDIKYRIHKMQEVHTVETDMKNAQVTVKGEFEPKKLVEYIHKKAGKHAVIVKQTPPKRKEDEKEKEKEKDCEKFNPCEYYQIHPPGLVYAPQLFSDENPNACSVM
ncbi:heavy metal-associated isoprenylated plant protein 7-like [Rhododendron vialii]|uniref:heavy metal-associated isoprenylated plant protein 7-like n=1 Tax=Rhododendron vialii TaxID=182163 RepID=UPI00265DA467|nr:heavy metal-associated isoprenylated plant protein 7-like [Rhododendron vialii]